MLMTIRIGTRSSNLALWQAHSVASALRKAGIETEIVEFKSSGDRSLGGNLSSSVGQFIHTIDDGLLTDTIDIAVHSSKDVPVAINEKIRHLAYMERGTTNDLILMKRKEGLESLDEVLTSETSAPLSEILSHFESGSTFGTVSGRRQSLLLSERPDLIPLAVRGHVETRINRLLEGRVEALVLAEVGIQRLNSVGALDPIKDDISAVRLESNDWPTAPGQGSVGIHCNADRYEEFSSIRQILNHPQTEQDIEKEREILERIGGGCLYPAGIEVRDDVTRVKISPKGWKNTFCEGRTYPVYSYLGNYEDMVIELPQDENVPVHSFPMDGPRFVSTLNSDRISMVLANNGIPMENISVIELNPVLDAWPRDFLNKFASKREWPYLVLTSPFAAKCAIIAAESNPDIARIQWLAIGEGTARACFRRGVTVAICAKSRNSNELVSYIAENIDSKTPLLIPRSNVAPNDVVHNLQRLGYSIDHWIGYENRPKSVDDATLSADDVLLLSSSSSAISWAENGLVVPNEIICMGNNARETILSLDHFQGSNVSVLKGPTTEYLMQWWKENRGR